MCVQYEAARIDHASAERLTRRAMADAGVRSAFQYTLTQAR